MTRGEVCSLDKHSHFATETKRAGAEIEGEIDTSITLLLRSGATANTGNGWECSAKAYLGQIADSIRERTIINIWIAKNLIACISAVAFFLLASSLASAA